MANENNVSSNGLKITIMALPFVPKPLEVGYFTPDSDIWNVADSEIGDAKTTPDGQSVFFGKQARIEASITLSGASKQAKILADIAQMQMRYGHVPPIVNNVTVIVTNEITGETETYIDGIVKSAPIGQGYTQESKADRTFTFSFGKRA